MKYRNVGEYEAVMLTAAGLVAGQRFEHGGLTIERKGWGYGHTFYVLSGKELWLEYPDSVQAAEAFCSRAWGRREEAAA